MPNNFILEGIVDFRKVRKLEFSCVWTLCRGGGGGIIVKRVRMRM